MQTLTGTVLSASLPKTVKIQVVRRWTHPLYHKTVTKKKNYLCHCDIAVKKGDKVVLVPVRPISKLKRWKVLKTLSS